MDLCGLPPTVASWSLAIIGLANIVGSLVAGCGESRCRSKYILALMYGSRALLIAAYLAAPKTALTFFVFAAGLGVTWLATVPPTAGDRRQALRRALPRDALRHDAAVAPDRRLPRRLARRHRLRALGNYHWMWYADMALAAAAAIVNLPIREPRPQAVAAA